MKLTKQQRIINYAKKHPEGFTPKELTTEAGIKDRNIWVVLSQMKKNGVLKHDPKTRTYTYVPYPGTQPLPEKPKLDPARENDAKTIQYLIEEQNRLHSEIALLDEKHDDALAVIRYLEDKLIKTIQYTARNGEGE